SITRPAWLAAGAGVYCAALVALSLVHLVAPQRSGLLAITQVFAPHLFLPLVLLVPLAIARGTTAARVAIVAAAVIGVVRFAPGMVSLPPAPTEAAEPVAVLTWNLAAGQAAGHLLIERLLASEADVVGLQEVRAEHVAAIEASDELTARFPYRVLEPRPGVLGMALLSRFPILDSTSADSPPLIVATVRGPGEREITLATAHPLPAQIRLVGGLVPVGYDATARDAALAEVRSAVEEWGTAPVIVLGDFNVTDREPGYAELTAGFVDAHAAVGIGPGSTWRPATLDFLPFGVLRIDYVFTGEGVRPLSSAVECITNAGDHCIVTAVLQHEQADLPRGLGPRTVFGKSN
ncbi:MAG TPA: endonuclease/exonuclease/phosphatase family protein, partial [Candidatus Caenarcaniphilales bacterium]|nr:endonuclease/exonuclease/phosphatase family protein [Candidatus Caenarcaniphilales bacterium]